MVEDTWVPGENHWPVAIHLQTVLILKSAETILILR